MPCATFESRKRANSGLPISMQTCSRWSIEANFFRWVSPIIDARRGGVGPNSQRKHKAPHGKQGRLAADQTNPSCALPASPSTRGARRPYSTSHGVIVAHRPRTGTDNTHHAPILVESGTVYL